jgi:hypothetical protein
MAAPLRTFFPRYNTPFFYRHLPQYQTSAAIHFAHGKAHDDLELTPLSRAYYYDAAADASYLEMLYDKLHTEPSMMMALELDEWLLQKDLLFRRYARRHGRRKKRFRWP